MNLEQLADTLVASAIKFRNEKLVIDVVPQLQNDRMTDKVVREILEHYMRAVEQKLPIEVGQIVWKKMNDFIPEAVKQIRLDSHMNNADDTDTLTQNNADAILVAFVNRACIPLDLALYTSDLVEG